jgi:hypothetical protein
MKPRTFRVILVSLACALLAGCGGLANHSPTIDVIGSYFPAWMVCIFAGIGLTLIARCILIALGLNAHIRPAAIVYPCLMLLFTMTVWLLFYRN